VYDEASSFCVEEFVSVEIFAQRACKGIPIAKIIASTRDTIDCFFIKYNV
jgi:hypothetical protein